VPKIKLIAPAPGNKYSNRTGKTSFPQLNLRILEAMTPPEFEVSIHDERIEELDFNDSPDLVCLSVLTSVATRAYEIADIYRSRNIPVIMGGIHTSFMPEEAMEHADSIVTGEAEGVWEKVLNDFKSGNLQGKYEGSKYPGFEKAFPILRTLRKPESYSVKHTVQSTRGCPYACEFCSVTKFWGNKYRFRQIDMIIKEIEQSGSRRIVFIDDNVVGNPKFARELFTRLIPLKIKWAGQASITVAKTEGLLDVMKQSGCEWLFIGIESLSAENLSEMKKNINDVQALEENIGKIMAAGINILGSFIFGFDHDDTTVFDKVVDFCIKTKLSAANFYILTPFPGTELYSQMESEGRMLTKKWHLFDGNHVVFKPKRMTQEELLSGYVHAYNRMYSAGTIFKRLNMRSLFNPQVFGLNVMRMKNRDLFRKWSYSTD
jgi:radical SAM superfamily enzyme YgiQ (UPF0313 family)